MPILIYNSHKWADIKYNSSNFLYSYYKIADKYHKQLILKEDLWKWLQEMLKKSDF